MKYIIDRCHIFFRSTLAFSKGIITVLFLLIIVSPFSCIDASIGFSGRHISLSKELIQEAIAPTSIEAGDILSIELLNQPETKIDHIEITPEGKLHYLFLDGFHVEGKSVVQVKQLLQQKLKDFFQFPQVSIEIQKSQSHMITILGKVKKPGRYFYKGPTTLRRLVSASGGIVSTYTLEKIPIANLDKSFIFRNNEKLQISIRGVLTEHDKYRDFPLQAGDIVYIASNLRKEQNIYVLGHVGRSLAIQFKPKVTLTYALTQARYRLSKHSKTVFIIRGSIQAPHLIKVNASDILKAKSPDVPLMAGDMIYIPGSAQKYFDSVLEDAIQSFGTTFGSIPL